MRDIDWSAREERYGRLASQYNDMADLVEQGNELRSSWLPKAIPRGRTPDWYRAKAEAYAQKAIECGTRDAEQQQVAELTRLMAMPEAARAHAELAKAAMLVEWVLPDLHSLPMTIHLATVRLLLEDVKQRFVDEGEDWPLDLS
jgi:hypothetical protein